MRMRRGLSVLLALIMALSIMPIAALAAEGDVAQVGETCYSSLNEAFADAQPGDTVKLLGDATVTEEIDIECDLTLDINQQEFSSTATNVIYVTAGKSFTLKNGTLNATKSGAAAIVATKGATVTVAADAIIESAGDGIYGTAVEKDGNATFNIYGTLNCENMGVRGQGPNNTYNIEGATINSKYWGVYQSGNFGGAKVTIKNSTITDTSEESIGVYISNSSATGKLQTLYIENSVITAETAVEAKYTDVTITGKNTKLTATVSPATMIEESSGSVSLGYAFAATHNGMGSSADSACGTIVIEDGCFQGEVGIQEPVGDKENAATISISGGYYTTDPSKYVVEDKDAVASDKPGYDYMIGIRKVDVETAVSAGEAAAAVQIQDDKVTAETVETAANDTETQSSLQDAAAISGMRNDPKVVGTEENAKEELAAENVTVDDQDTITVVIQPYLDVKVQDAQTSGPEKSMTVDIKALYDVVATTNPDDIRLEADGSDPQNAVKLESRQTMKVTSPVTIKLPLPDGFVSKTSDPVYVKHIKGSKTYVYKADVTEASGAFTATFVNPDGFSLFILTNETAASITDNGQTQYYDTLKDAVSAVKDGQTIKLEKENSETVTVKKTVSFTVEPSANIKGSITNGSNTTKQETNSDSSTTYTFVYTAPSSGGSGSGDDDGYSVSVDAGKHGDVTVSPRTAEEGETVTVTVKPDKGYALDGLTVTAQNGKKVKVTESENGKFTFKMPDGRVTVSADFVKADGEPRFTDIPNDYWAVDAIQWAADNGYMNGSTATTFNPEGLVTRQQLWMILARLSGYQPADFAEARVWAMNSGISDGTFPGAAVSRQQLVTILHRYAMRMGYDVSVGEDTNILSYYDVAMVSEYAIPAVQWAAGDGIIQGTNEGNILPLASTTRAQFAVILSRFCENVVE